MLPPASTMAQLALTNSGLIRAADWRDMTNDVASWNALAQQASEPNPFFESWYLLPGLQAFDQSNQIKLLRFETNGLLAGLMPLAQHRRYYGKPIPHLAAWLHANCFLGAPLVAAGYEREFWRSQLAWADRNAGLALFLHLDQLPLNGPLYDALKNELAEQNRPAGIVHREERAMLASDATSDDYFTASLSGKKRKELRRQHNRLAELGEVKLSRQTDISGLEQWIIDFLALESQGWKGDAGSALALSPATDQLFRHAMQGAAQNGKLERLSITLNAKPIAMLASFLTPPGAFSYKTTFDEDYARFSPGVLLQRENLRILERKDIAWTDSCAAADHPMIDHIWRERRPIGKVSIAIGGRARQLICKALLKAEGAEGLK